MTITRTAAAVAIVIASWSGVFAARAGADQETLARAKALYTAAAYDEALALLNQFESGGLTDALEVKQYRAFCLLALGRSDDARRVIQEIVESNPLFQPPQAQVSPRGRCPPSSGRPTARGKRRSTARTSTSPDPASTWS
jgi:hypothetical protein